MHEPLARLLERTYSAAEREVIYRLIRGCWQCQHFAADPIPTRLLGISPWADPHAGAGWRRGGTRLFL